MTATSHAAGPILSLDEAYAHCAAIAKGHYENFSVATLFLPRSLRPSFHAVYAFCRYTDDLGDEAMGDRLPLLDDWESELDAVYQGTPSGPIMVALQDTVRKFEIPDEPFRMLIQANRMDQGSEALGTMNDNAITVLFVVDSGAPVGIVHMHDCLRAGIA